MLNNFFMQFTGNTNQLNELNNVHFCVDDLMVGTAQLDNFLN